MKTILVTTDFSPAATNAANYAADLALDCRANLILLHVYQIPMLFLEVPLASTIDEMESDAEKELDKLKDALSLRHRSKLTIGSMVRMGSFLLELQTVCEKVQPYYVIMGSQGTTAAERLVLGGHAVNAMKHLLWPLITVPPGASFSSVKKIGIACDFHKVPNVMPVDEIKALVKDFQASLYVINTGSADAFNPGIIYGCRLLDEQLKPVKPNYRFITNPDTNTAILDFAEKNGLDMLIVMPKQHGLFDLLIHKSHTKKLVLHSPIPVMALHH